MRLSSLLASTVLAGAFAALAASPAAAAGISFTWNPSGASPALSAQGAFTANNMVVSDFATITVNPADLSHVQETAILPVTQFQLNGVPVTSGVASGYQLYFYVTATSTLSGLPTGSNSVSGAFTSLTYTLFGVNGTCSYSTSTSAPSANCVGTTDILATGSLAAPPGTENQVHVDNGIPSANALVTSAAGLNAGTFFQSPSIGTFDFESAFTNTLGVSNLTILDNGNSVITINGGGGNVDLLPAPIPEPVTLSVFGAGLVGAAALRRRKAKKA